MYKALWSAVVRVVGDVVTESKPRHTYHDRDIVLIFLWAVLHDRPVSWACHRQSWPIWEHRRALPWPSTMTRRLRTPQVRKALDACEVAVRELLGRKDTVFAIDGKPLPIGGSSSDRDAGFGRANGCMAKGYKLHAIVGESGAFWGWEVHPMNKDERYDGKRIIRSADIHDVLLGDRNYDANHLFELAGKKGVQLLTERRYRRAEGLGHHHHSRYRLRCIKAMERPGSPTRALHERRPFIERVFGNLVSVSYGLGDLPAWARRLHRVRRWVQAKLILFMLGRTLSTNA